MRYTMDSLEHVETALKEQHPEYNIYSKPIIYSGDQMSNLTHQNNRFFFGVLTVNDTVTVDLTYNTNPVITVDSGSQIIVMFSAAEFKNLQGNVDQPKGLFRGFEINIQTP